MPTVLVVDDSAVDRRLVGGLLATDGDLNVQYAAHGEEALAVMDNAVPKVSRKDLPDLGTLGDKTGRRKGPISVRLKILFQLEQVLLGIQLKLQGAESAAFVFTALQIGLVKIFK